MKSPDPTGIPNVSFKPNQRELGFEMVELEELFHRKEAPLDHSPLKPHRPIFYAVLILTEGSVVHQLDFQDYPLIQGDALVISKGQVHAFGAQSGYKGYIVLFTEEFLFNQLAPPTLSKVLPLYNYHLNTPHFHAPEENEAFIRQIHQETGKTPPSIQPQVMAALLSTYLLKLAVRSQETHADHAQDQGYEIFDRFKHSVENRYAQTRNAKDYASELAVSYKHLNEVCKRFTLKTAKAFIDDYVMLESKRFLSSTSLSVKEIAYLIGFDEPTNFVKYYKKGTGQTPNQFRSKFA